MTYARVENGVVVELIEVPDGLAVNDMFHPDVVSSLVECDASVGIGWSFDGSSFAAPEPSDEDEEIPVPTSVTLRQAKLQLSRAGLLPAVDEFIAAMDGQPGEEARIEWNFATELRRDHQLVEALGPQFNLSSDDIDGLFVEAAKIT